MATITTDDGTILNYRWDGLEEGPVLVLSNSLGADLGMWDDQVGAFGTHFKLLRYDDRGHGGSSTPDGPYVFDRLGRDVVNLLDALNLKRFSWCGLSKGGMLGMWLARQHPDRIKRLVLSNTSAHLPPADMWDDRARTAREKGLGFMAPTILERWFTEGFRSRAPDRVARVRDMLYATPGEGYAGSCEAIRDIDQREAIRAITVPTLVIAGAADPATPPEHGREIHEAIAGSRFELIEDAAHLSNIEQTERFNDVVLSFLAGRDA